MSTSESSSSVEAPDATLEMFKRKLLEVPAGGGCSPAIMPYKYLPWDDYCFRVIEEKDRIYKITKHAGSALADFNSKNNTDYKLVKCEDICYNVRSRYRIHCNFTAKPDTAPLIAGDFSTNLFFADLEQNLRGNIVPLSCHMLNYDSKVKLGCAMCSEHIFHPASEDEGICMREALIKHYKRIFSRIFSEKEGALLETAAVLFSLKMEE